MEVLVDSRSTSTTSSLEDLIRMQVDEQQILTLSREGMIVRSAWTTALSTARKNDLILIST